MPTVFAIHTLTGNHALVSNAIATLPDTELAGRSASAVEALRVFDTLAPDAVTVDVRLADGDGIELALRLRGRRPGLGVVLFGPAGPRLLRRAVAAGIVAYVPETADAAQAATAIHACLAGGASFSSRSLSAALQPIRPVDLSERERQVNTLIQGGFTPPQIAAGLKVSESAVRTYVARARAKARTLTASDSLSE
jgi:DNA-binding NarL/FixJ family response regulator